MAMESLSQRSQGHENSGISFPSQSTRASREAVLTRLNQIFCFLHFPRLNRMMPAAAMAASATTIEKNAPFDCRPMGIASQYASGISRNHKPNWLTQVGVIVS